MSTPSDPDSDRPGPGGSEQVPSLYAPRPAPARADSSPQRFRRPPEMYAAAVFLTLAALPLVLVGGGLALQLGALGANLRQRIIDSGNAAQVDALILTFRLAGAVLVLVGVAFSVLAWVAARPRSWARKVVTVLASVEMILLILAMIVTAPDPVSIGIVLLAGAGAALLYVPRSAEFLLAHR